MIRATILTFALAMPALADAPEIVGAKAHRSGMGWKISVTLLHGDEGWDHYADRWQVLGPDGAVLGERVLAHPHVDEQPFTRSQSGIVIPDDLEEVTVRAHDSVHGWGGVEMTLPLKGRF